MISDALHLVLIHIRMAEKHSSLYIYLLLSHSIIFRGLIWCPKLAILLKIGVFLLGENIVVGHMGVRYAIRSSLDHSYISNGGQGTLKQQWMSLLTTWHHNFMSNLVPKLVILLEIGVFLFGEKIYWRPQGDQICYERLSQSFSYI